MAASRVPNVEDLWKTSKWDRIRPCIALGVLFAILFGCVVFVRRWQVTLVHWKAAARLQAIGGQVDWDWGNDWWRGEGTTSVSMGDSASRSRLTDREIQDLSQLRFVDRLDLSQCPNLTDAGLKAIEPLTMVKELDLTGVVRLTDAGLAVVGNLHELRVLGLGQTGVTGAGLAHLAGLKHLEYLDLDETAVSDDHLTALDALPALKIVHLTRTRVTEKGALALLRKHPRLEIHHELFEDPLDFAGDVAHER